MPESSFRLPRTIIPNHYDIELDLDMDDFTFTGRVAVDIAVGETVTEIVLNAADIDIKEAFLTTGGRRLAIGGISYDERYERAALTLDDEAATGEYRLEIDYSGVINDQLRGLYRSSYRAAAGTEHPIATSQCQATDARRVFPCWDEPDFKATFKTSMTVPLGVEAYSNAQEVARRETGGKARFDFATTMRMSTYLLAFIAGPFEATDPVVVRGTPIRIIVPRGNLHLADVALRNAVFTFEYLTDYYGIPYPGDKLDHIAIPDFAAGAMENVGLITYRDAYLVIDEAKASQSELQNCLDVIGHEVTHQWFGNLVTMAWWEGTWLNEAFASFLEMKATDAMRPEWKRWLAFANGEVPWAMGTDQLASTRPIEYQVNAPEEVDQMFDAITYGKGSAVLHMIDEFIGVESFRRGVGDYLRRHAYANTVTGDLWQALDGVSDWPVRAVMDTWVYQRGFPQIEVRQMDGGLRLGQRRYLVIADETDTTIWKVPLQLRGSVAGSEFHRKVLLEDDEIGVDLGAPVDWVVANAGGYGFYRTRYADDVFAVLLANIGQLDDIERLTLVSDTMAFVRNGQVDSSHFLDLVERFGAETEQAIWSVINGGLATIEHHALHEEVREAFQGFVKRLTGPALDRLGWDPRPDDSDLDRKLRGDLVSAMGILGGDQDTIDRCRRVVDQLLGGASPDPEVATAALNVYARHAGADEYRLLWETYRVARTPLDQVRYLGSVAGVPGEEQAVDTLDKVIDGDIRTQDGFWVFARLLSGKAGPAVWRSAASRWDALLEMMPGTTRTRVVEGISALSQPQVAAEVAAFFAEHPLPEA
ncbi:MAG: M1 family metallopeptidase, partial [Actinobacteria bacterium]|nr:M1 family metallopeptidase [Actinomycetota bacterium]